MITAVAVVPTTPLALEGMPGRRHSGLAAIAAAARRATADLACVDLVVAIAGGTDPAVITPPPTDLLGYGLHLPLHRLTTPPADVREGLTMAIDSASTRASSTSASATSTASTAVASTSTASTAVASTSTATTATESPPTASAPTAPGSAATGSAPTAPGQADLAVLARWVPEGTPSAGVIVPADAAASLAEAVAAAVMRIACGARLGIIVAGDLGAGHGLKPPRPFAAVASAALQDRVVAALDNGRPSDLIRLDERLAADSAARAIGPLRVLGHLLQQARIGTVVRAAAAPLGVGYVVAQGG